MTVPALDRRGGPPAAHDAPPVPPAEHPGRRLGVRLILAAAGLLLAVAAFAALRAIPRGLDEFEYYRFPGYRSVLEPLPFAAMNGFTPEQLSSLLARLVLLGPACLLLGIALAPMAACWRWPSGLRPRVVALLGALLVAGAALAVFRGIPTQDDEATYLMQAEHLSWGWLAEAPISFVQRWSEPFTLFTDRATTGKYLFGEPLVLSVGLRFGVPILGHVLLAAATLWLVHRAARNAGDDRTALLGSALLAISPAVVFTSAAPVSQVPALAGLAVAVWALGRRDALGGFLAAAGIGLAVVSRPQMGAPCGAVLLAAYAVRDRRVALGAAVGAIPWVLSVAFYDAAITGRLARLPYQAFMLEQYGFGWPLGAPGHGQGYYFNTPKALMNLPVTLIRMNGWGLGWPLSLAGPVAWFATGRPGRRAVAPWAWVALATFVFQLGYYANGVSDTGPVYQYAALPFVALSTAAVLVRLAAGRRGPAVVGTATMCVLLGTGSFLVEHALRLRRLTDAIDAPTRAIPPSDTPTLVFVEPRPLQIGWVMGVPHRLRALDEPVVFFPRAHREAVQLIRERWPDRRCLYEYLDPASSRYEVVGCDRMPALAARFDRAVRYLQYPLPRPALDGGWREAFRWIPGVAP